jgi:hypothetical protein
MYYIGFFVTDMNKMMKFYSSKTPTKKMYPYFGKVLGPYETEQDATNTMTVLKRGYGYKENPAVSERQRRFMCAELGRLRAGKRTKTRMTEKQLRDFCRKKNPAKVISHRQALALTKKIIAYGKKLLAHERAGVKENPGEQYHNRKFLEYLKELEKYKVGSPPYISTLAKAYEHLESAKDSMHDKVG